MRIFITKAQNHSRKGFPLVELLVNKKGMSLVELLIVAGLLGIVSLTSLQLITTSLQASSVIKIQASEEILRRSMRSFVNESCFGKTTTTDSSDDTTFKASWNLGDAGTGEVTSSSLDNDSYSIPSSGTFQNTLEIVKIEVIQK